MCLIKKSIKKHDNYLEQKKKQTTKKKRSTSNQTVCKKAPKLRNLHIKRNFCG